MVRPKQGVGGRVSIGDKATGYRKGMGQEEDLRSQQNKGQREREKAPYSGCKKQEGNLPTPPTRSEQQRHFTAAATNSRNPPQDTTTTPSTEIAISTPLV